VSMMEAPGNGDPATAFEGWEPRTVVESDCVTAGAALALHGLLDAPGPAPAEGEPLPMLWHWLAFLPRVPQSELGEDGHPRLGTFLPPVALPRRMFAGGRLRSRRPLTVSARLTRRGVVASVRNKRGRSGELCFVTVKYEITDGRGGELEEEQDLVYLAASRAPAPLRSGDASQREPHVEGEETSSDHPWALDIDITSTLLFRFSALTYNAHRIHYDLEFARDVEGYPDLVVQGPLQAVLLAELCRRAAPHQPLEQFSFQAKSPAFRGGTMRFCGCPGEDGKVPLEARDDNGSVTMVADATLRPLTAD